MATFEDVSITHARIEEINGAKTPYKMGFTVGTEATNVVNVAVQLQTESGASLGQQVALEIWLSSLSTGLDLGTAPDGAVAIGTNGVIIASHTAKTHMLVTTNSSGQLDINFTESGALVSYLVVKNPVTGELHVSTAMTHAT